MKNQAHYKEAIWTNKKVEKFWDYVGTKVSSDQYFSKQLGDSIIKFVNSSVTLSGEVLDFGCGDGSIMEKLLSKGIPCTGLDFSVKNISLVEKKLRNYPVYRGAYVNKAIPTQFSTGLFDAVFLIETIEHILHDDLVSTINELNRILKVGGYLIVTTPNDENLEDQKVICPECNSTFHRWQHVRKWTRDSLVNFMNNCGFKMVKCSEVTFRVNSKINFLREALSKIRKDKKPHLIYIGKKI